MSMTPQRRAEIAAMAAAATPGDWEDRFYGATGFRVYDEAGEILTEVKSGNKADTRFIAHARQDIPDLLAEIDRIGSFYRQEISELGAERNSARLEVERLLAEVARPNEPTGRKLHGPTYLELQAENARLKHMRDVDTKALIEYDVLRTRLKHERDALQAQLAAARMTIEDLQEAHQKALNAFAAAREETAILRQQIEAVSVARDSEERFWLRVAKSDGCWAWTGVRNSKGYGVFNSGGKPRRAHRVAYELSVGPIPSGLELDHLCRNHGCVNPSHLEPVTTKTNTLRGISICADNAVKTHCMRGHEFTPENTIVHSTKGNRTCRTCKNDWAREKRAKGKL